LKNTKNFLDAQRRFFRFYFSVGPKTEKPDPDACYVKPLGPLTPLGGRQPKVEPVTALDFIKSEATAAGDSGDRFIKPELLLGHDSVSNGGGGGHNGPPPPPPPGAFPSTACSGCGYGIHEEFILKVGEKSWHSQCLRQGDPQRQNYMILIYDFCVRF
jgi:hypothetical protein